jgi:hypothetical protein
VRRPDRRHHRSGTPGRSHDPVHRRGRPHLQAGNEAADEAHRDRDQGLEGQTFRLRGPRWGTQYAILKSSKLSTRQITYDLIEWYDGKQAVKACAEDGKKPAENDYCEG